MGEIVGTLRTRWSPADLSRLEDMVGRGLTLSQIRLEFPNRNYSGLRSRMTTILRRSLPRSPQKDGQDERLVAIQARLVELLRLAGWDEAAPAWEGGPTVAQLEAGPLPHDASMVRLRIGELDRED